MFDKLFLISPQLLLTVFCMVSLLLVSKPKFSMKITIIISTCFTLLLLLTNTIIFLNQGPNIYKDYFILTVFIPEAILAFLLGKRKQLSAITAIINAFISFYILMLTLSAFSNWMTKIESQLILIVIGSACIFVYLKLFYAKIHNEIETTLPKFFKYLLIYATLMFLEITIYQFLIGAYAANQPILRLEIFGVAILSVYILSIVFMRYLIKQYYHKIVQLKDNEWLENHLQYTIEQIKQQERKESELRILHHDIRHILTTTSTLIQNNENDKALEFLNKYIALSNKSRTRRYCEDSFINSALDYYYNICNDNDIKFNCKLNNIEEALKIPSHEVAVVISNCLENAINASLKLETNRLINLTFLNNNGRLVLRVENNYNGIIEVDNQNHPISTEENHGIGTASIKYFAKRNDLIIDYEITNSLFKITILFK